jgi:hypothetical protein
MSIPKIIKIHTQIVFIRSSISSGLSGNLSGKDKEVTDAINQLSFFGSTACSSFVLGCSFSVIAHQSTKFCISV